MSSEKSYCEAQQIYPKQVYVDKTLIECHRLEEKVKIKNGTKKIASTAFCSSKVNEVTLPDSVEEIEPHAFFNCQDLHRITFGKNIKTIENDSFINCPNIHEIVFPENADMIHAALDYVQGSNRILEKLVSGEWDEQFLVAEPGHLIRHGDFF